MKNKFASNFNRGFFVLILMSFFLIQCVHINKQNKSESETSTRVEDDVPLREPNSVTRKKNNRLLSSTNDSVSKIINYQIQPFERCENPSKYYIEDQIVARLSSDYSILHPEDWDQQRVIPMACVQYAMKQYRGSFAFCQSENEKPKIGAPRPCLTQSYLNLTYNAFHDVQNCFNLKPQSAFLQVMIESGFHVNAINKSGFDSGSGQMTKNGLLRVRERNLIETTRRLLLENSNPACQRIASVVGAFGAEAFKKEQRCSVISLPQNPYRSFLFHYLHSMRDKLFFQDQLFRRFPQLIGIIDEDVTEQLVYFAYNRGISGTLQLISGYVENRKAVQHDLHKEDLNLWKNFSDVRKILNQEPIKREILKTHKIRRLSFAEYAVIHDKNYLSLMSEARDAVAKNVGPQCFQ